MTHSQRFIPDPAITDSELSQINRANSSGRQPVVFVHGLWLLSSSWEPWAKQFEEAGYIALSPGWPGDPHTVREANEDPNGVAGTTIGMAADHYERVIRKLNTKPILVGHSFGGLLVQILASRGLAAATVALAPAPFRGVLPLPLSALRASWPVLQNPANRGRAISLSFDQFRYAFANAVEEGEAKELYARFAVPAPGAPIFQAATANLNPWTEAKVDLANADRGPLLIIAGERDHTVPWALCNAAYKRQERNKAETRIIRIPDRGHAVTIDHGWREVADLALEFVTQFSPALESETTRRWMGLCRTGCSAASIARKTGATFPTTLQGRYS